MGCRLSVLWLLLATQAQGATIWIVGQNFLGVTDGISPPKIIEQIPTVSSALDPGTCALWTTDGQSLKRWDKSLQPTSFGASEKLVSDFHGGTFLSLALDGMLEEKDAQGVTKKKTKGSWAFDSRQAYYNGADGWSLNVDEKEHNARLVHFGKSLEEDRSTALATKTVLFPNYNLLVDETAKRLWVSFSLPSLDYPYVPVVKEFDLAGILKNSYAFAERGRVFDMCLDKKDGSTLVSRDIPSENGFTVPVYSYLEKLVSGIKPETNYEAQVNDFIDSMICEPDELWMVQHSIWGDSGVYLVHWDRKNSGPGERKFLLPGLVSRIVKCES